MDIPAYSMKMSYVNVMQELNINMIDKALDQVELAGEQIAMMIAATAVLPTMPIEGGFDVSI
ncbi:MAG: putative motility protein [Defluviitaleaceae bacterium]|nr:putative motility protein [Defluviitaleaceae bacterium]